MDDDWNIEHKLNLHRLQLCVLPLYVKVHSHHPLNSNQRKVQMFHLTFLLDLHLSAIQHGPKKRIEDICFFGERSKFISLSGHHL